MSDIEVSKKMAAMAVDALEDRKGEDIKVIDIYGNEFRNLTAE